MALRMSPPLIFKISVSVCSGSSGGIAQETELILR